MPQEQKVNGQLTDDKNDPGQIVELNLSFPKPGTYLLAQTCSNGATIFRSNKSLSDTVNTTTNLGYPYTIRNILSMTGALYNGAPITTGYYYLYDMKFKSMGCPSPRSVVKIATGKTPEVNMSPLGAQTWCGASFTNWSGVLITAKSADNPSFQWLLNEVPISGATKSTYQANKSGTYKVKATLNGLCANTSSAFNLNLFTLIPPAIFYDGGIMKITGTGAIQWYLNGDVIPGATQSTYTPVKSGFYSVSLKDVSGCVATSDILIVNIAIGGDLARPKETASHNSETVKENPFSTYVTFPNPAVDILNVGLPQVNAGTYAIEIIDMNGRIFFSNNIRLEPGSNQLKIDISKIPAGTYLVRLPEIVNQPSMKFIKN
jgi:hypothetical protein